MTGGSGVLGRAVIPLLRGEGLEVDAPVHSQLDLFALGVPSGVYNVVRDDGRVANARLRAAAGWRPRH